MPPPAEYLDVTVLQLHTLTRRAIVSLYTPGCKDEAQALACVQEAHHRHIETQSVFCRPPLFKLFGRAKTSWMSCLATLTSHPVSVVLAASIFTVGRQAIRVVITTD